ncbi:MAG TPA: GNAT family N-acetyltransferase [Marinagarivorans sp.]|nr:GNAT family N-acetyltransferase [Cellvibrionaceae bacterium]HMY38875.1 GNAT family N-acetyltransferase [Marinagarivorans sp.]HNG58479.1 GNAT family N-acetyltransferase [Cellvibrionaceae bacterium]
MATFRPANQSDCRWLWQVREHPSVAMQSLNPSPIPYIKHCRWFRHLLRSQQRRLDIFIDDISGQRLGYIRAEPYQTGQLLSWAIAPEFHGQGLGKQMLSSWCQAAETTLWAQIKAENSASKAIAAQARFTQIEEKNGIETWLKTLTY